MKYIEAKNIILTLYKENNLEYEKVKKEDYTQLY